MIHPERKEARAFDSPLRCREFTDIVYSGTAVTNSEGWRLLQNISKKYNPAPSKWKILYGDLHGHSSLSDGSVSPDEFYRNLRDLSHVDFCALTDHDHGGVGHSELWKGMLGANGKTKWEIILEKAEQYNAPGKFSTIIGYERDSYPWFSNMVLYFQDKGSATLVRGSCDGEITSDELRDLYTRNDVLYGPHTCFRISDGSYLLGREKEYLPKLFEIYSRSGAYEYYNNPFSADEGMRGGSYIDALESGAHVACIACSDDHNGFGGRDINRDGETKYTGLTGVLAQENTREAIFDALQNRRCFAFMGQQRIAIDFRINSHDMGEIFLGGSEDRAIYFRVESEIPVSRVDLIKNGQSVAFWHKKHEDLIFDYRPEREEDYYYLRILFADGRFAWTSPIWVQR